MSESSGEPLGADEAALAAQFDAFVDAILSGETIDHEACEL